ncbi:MAG: SAM-dependent DNA methyltransferase [Bacteroidetes bacterium]|nr:MAG: SAM-dependent DNA methyltransferase [Bacteroidota bacterium]
MTSIETFYSELAQIRELFHKYGKFDDANAKLDEIAKYITMYVYEAQKGQDDIKSFILAYEQNNDYQLVTSLKRLFSNITEHIDIFDNKANLNIEDNDNHFAYLLLKLVVSSVDSVLNGSKNFDLLNECFGHFIRDSFRNHIEDAQYMTPYEAVELMCEMALFDLKDEENNAEFTILDPCCGVGSFLSTFYQKNNIVEKQQLRLIGQDKVERMVKLSKINLFLANIQNQVIANDNSLVGKSFLDEYEGKIDLILTNPPFGAKFSSGELKHLAKQHYPLLQDLILKNGTNFSSEILFIDRCLQMLKPNGKLLAVVPDSVISSAGLANMLRCRLAYKKNVQVKAIIELPAVTFAQAGTRTKTSILYLQKTDNLHKSTFMAKCENIGFEVSTKKGATVKYAEGENELPKILTAYKKTNFDEPIEKELVLSQKPSCVLINSELLKTQSWTASHYNAEKYEAINLLKNNEIQLVKLSEIAKFETNIRKKEVILPESKCISVLHIVNSDNLNYEELLTYNPKYQGTVCKGGDLLFSKINPRILRVLVVPELDFPLTCSSEFEIMNSKTELSNYALKLLLMLPYVQTQINATTSGTSSSHNRIKSQDLGNILIPLPYKNTEKYQKLVQKASIYEQKDKQFNHLRFEMFQLKNDVFELTI